MKPLSFVIVLSSLVLAGCGGDPEHPDIAAFNRQAQRVEKTYTVAMSRLVTCMIDDDQHEPHPQFDITADAARFELPGVFRVQLTATGPAETRAVVIGIPGERNDDDGRTGLDHYVRVLDHCAGRDS